MSNYISGQDIAAQKGLQGFEFVREYVAKGLQPYNQIGIPVSPKDVIYKTNKVESLMYRASTMRDENPEALSTISDIETATERVMRVMDISWDGYELPNIEAEAQTVIAELLQCFYLREAVPGLQATGKKATPAGHEPIGRQPTPRPSRGHSEQCIKIAKMFWAIDPTIHPSFIAESDEIQKVAVKKNGDPYSKEQIMSWIREYWPEKYIGIPKKPKGWPFKLL